MSRINADFEIDVREAAVTYGSPETVREKLYDVQRDYHIEEVLAVTAIRDFPKRLHSYELLGETFAQVAAS